MMHLSWLYECLLLEIIGMTSANKDRKLVFNVQFQYYTDVMMVVHGLELSYTTFIIRYN
jgi:hypothetical protein